LKVEREVWRTNLTTEVAQYAKLRPMRVEMYCIHWNRCFGKNLPRRNVETLHATSSRMQSLPTTPKTRSNECNTL